MSSNHSEGELEKFTKHARAGAIMTVVGASIVAGSLIYSGFQFAALQKAKAQQEQQLNAARAELSALRAQVAEAQKALSDMQEQSRKLREAFTYLQLGVKKFFGHDFNGALPYYEKAIEVNPTNPVLFDLKGYSLLRAGRTHDAVVALEHAIALDPGYVWGHYNLALAYWAEGEKDQAVAEVRKTIEINPSLRKQIREDGQFSAFRESAEFRRLVHR
jgi:tetratricopeptide (TPR) repeat protein